MSPDRETTMTSATPPPAAQAMERLLAAARGLASDLAAGREADGDVERRLRRSVIRPLERVSPQDGESGGGTPHGPATVAERLWLLAEDATRLRAAVDTDELQEATAALQDLAHRAALAGDPDTAADRLSRLREIQSALPARIRTASDGPYLVTNVERLTTWLGEPQVALPQMALCRCGASATKPFCDGAHADAGFSGAKDPERVPDRRDQYAGQQVEILDNRGLCAHSGFCSDRLATVFRVDQEPFVAPSGARMDEIIRAVRACPSGALSFAIDGREARDEVDQDRPPAIEVSKDGPYRVTGAIELEGPGGAAEPRNEGASHEHFSLCRCGHSQNKPFCSGMHWRIGFRDPVPDPDHAPTLFEWAGGFPALTRMTRIFYSKYVPEDPLLAPLFANMSPDHPERVAAWLGETFGGPKAYSEGYGGYVRMVSQHLGKALREEQRARWVQLLARSADDAGLPADPEFRAAFTAYLEWGSRIALENSQPGAHPPKQMPVPRWWWVCDATPGSRPSALAPEPEQEAPVALPGADDAVSFERHIRGLFRRMDRESMRFAFDLWSHEDVARHADAILDRLQAGTMPCDGAWAEDRLDAFRRWVEAGKPA
jgi:CDGSH-type Zn-finger protein/truncated hemoglobin YjbI/ferredoxin